MIEQLLREKFENPNFDNPTGQEPNPKQPDPPPPPPPTPAPQTTIQPQQPATGSQEVVTLYEPPQETNNEQVNTQVEKDEPKKKEKKKKAKIQFDDFNLPKNNRKKILIGIPAVVILAVAGIIGLVVSNLYNNEARKLTLHANSIITRFDEIDSKYQDIQRLREEELISIEKENGLEVLGDTSDRLRSVRYYNDINRVDPVVIQDVLGLEDDTAVGQMRKERAVYLDMEQIYIELESSSEEFKNIFEGTYYVKRFKKDLNPPVQDTLDHSIKKQAEIDETIKLYDLLILYTSWAYKVRLGIHESILRETDEFSIKKLENMLYEVDEFRDRARNVETDPLNDEMKNVHEELVNELTSDGGTVVLLQQLVGSLKRNDPEAMERSLISLEAHSQAAIEGAVLDSSHIYDNIRIDIRNLKDKWVAVREEL
jgi:hypothetical protein